MFLEPRKLPTSPVASSIADSAAAEVFLHGCCSSLNKTSFHHLPSVKPPPLVLSRSFKAEILSQTVQEGHIQSRSVCQSFSAVLPDGKI